MIKISVAILAWNNADVLQHSLPMLRTELDGIKHEIIVVDNGSTDNTPELVLKYKCLLLRFNENYGISTGKNRGISATDGEHLLLLDGDILPVPNSIRLMSQWLDDNQDKHAIGMYPNRFCTDMNQGHLKPCEEYCNVLFEPKEHKCACLFYGMYRRSIFHDGLRMDESGAYGKVGYGWEDHDFFMRMKERGIKQYVAHINHPKGRYHHRINSSIRIMGDATFRESMQARNAQFKERWGNAT